ncbi:uncharacterized protein METZ01_LOCUS356682 [marine metagenome]|uniref:Uncharacterized protein n=1 Tax=marine metagenome TaxID=408172 RepID=A0A382S3X9_9ZZZZ
MPGFVGVHKAAIPTTSKERVTISLAIPKKTYKKQSIFLLSTQPNITLNFNQNVFKIDNNER